MPQPILYKSRKYEYIAVSFILTAIYFLVVLAFDYLPNLNVIIFWSGDSRSYRAVGNWLLGISNTNATIIRPFFYPLMLNLSRSFAGNYGIWFYQLLLWIVSGVLLYWSIRKVTNNIVLSICGVFIFASNLTLLLLTLHALTEVTTVFLLITMIVLVINKRRYKGIHYWPIMVLIVSLLTVTKPVFIVLLLALLVYLIFSFFLWSKRWKNNIKLLGYLVLALSPVLVQLSLMKIKHNKYTISQIGNETLKNYYLSQVYGEVNNMSVRQAREYTSSFQLEESLKYLLAHYKVSFHTYFRRLKTNIDAASQFVNVPDLHPLLYRYMKITNIVYFWLHILMILPSVIVLIVLAKKRKWDNLEMILSLIFPIYLIIFTAGFSFWQGDRLVLSSLPLWIVLYSLIFSIILQLIRGDRPVLIRPYGVN